MGPHVEKHTNQIRTLRPAGLAKLGEIYGSIGTWRGSDRQEALGRVVGQVWNSTELFFRTNFSWCRPIGYSSCSWNVRIWTDISCSVTLYAGQHLPLTHPLHLLNNIKSVNAFNGNLTGYWRNVCLGHQCMYLKNAQVMQLQSTGRINGRFSWKLILRQVIRYCLLILYSLRLEDNRTHIPPVLSGEPAAW
jgi:hypothetical protein